MARSSKTKKTVENVNENEKMVSDETVNNSTDLENKDAQVESAVENSETVENNSVNTPTDGIVNDIAASKNEDTQAEKTNEEKIDAVKQNDDVTSNITENTDSQSNNTETQTESATVSDENIKEVKKKKRASSKDMFGYDWLGLNYDF